MRILLGTVLRFGNGSRDISVFKNFPILSESRIIQFRGEFYNMFNRKLFSAIDSTVRFGAAGNQVNTRLSQVTRDVLGV